MSAPVSVSIARAQELLNNGGFPSSSEELRAAASTIISQAQALALSEARITELETSVAELERQRHLAISMVAVALKIEVL